MRPRTPPVAALLSAAIVIQVLAGQQPGMDFTSAGSPAAVQETQHLTIRASSSRQASPGSRVSLFLDVAPKPTMHVYAPGQATYIPVSVHVSEHAVIKKAHAAVFPAAEKYFFKPLNETQLVYSKPFRIVQDVTLAEAPAAYNTSTLTIAGTLRYQACDDAICYLPKSVAVTWKLKLE
jgi:DsbC/DsbD-like thiol-disulfide interchange protein